MVKNFKYYDLLSNVLVVIPHSGTICPEEISVESLSKYQNKLADECIDWHTNSLYDFRYIMNNKQIINPISNVYVNVNRHPDELDESVPLKFEDIPIYDKDPSTKTRKLMIEKYHDTFHEKIRNKNKIFIFDGHSTTTGMKDAAGVKVDYDIMLCNYSNSKLDPKGGRYSCPDMYLDYYMEELDKRLVKHHIEKRPKEEIEKNSTYTSTYGHIEAVHCTNHNKARKHRSPGFMQETNEKLYLTDGKLDMDKLEELRRIFAESLMTMIIKMERYLT